MTAHTPPAAPAQDQHRLGKVIGRTPGPANGTGDLSASVIGRHRRATVWTRADIALVAGRARGSFWRLPTDGRSWTADMSHGMRAEHGRIIAVSPDDITPWAHPNRSTRAVR